jgi:hypothetical protein
MKELKEQIPRIRDDSDTRALMLGSKTCRELNLEAQNVDWRKFLDEIGRHRRQGHSESEIDWKRVLEQCSLSSTSGEKSFWLASLVGLFSFRRLVPEVVRLAVAILLVFALFKAGDKVSDLNGDLEALRRENETLKQEYSRLRSDLARTNESGEESQQRLAGQQQVLEDRLVQLQTRNNTLSKTPRRPSNRGELIAIRDTSGQVTISGDGTVSLPQTGNPPPHLSRLVSELATRGWVTNTEPALAALESLHSGETRGRLRSAEKETVPIPVSPLLSAIRSTSPLLRWKPVTGATEYRITVAYPEQKENGKIIWRSDPISANEVKLPPNLLQRGEAYLWQVETIGQRPVLSPAVGFWVMNDSELQEIEAFERSYKNAELVLAAVYEAYGLYEDALLRVEKLQEMNPTNPIVREMMTRLRSQLNLE